MPDPTSQQIQQWKSEYGPIFQVQDYILRGVTLAEANRIFNGTLTSVEIEDELVKAALLWPEEADFEESDAGIVSSMAEEIRNISGFGDPKAVRELLDGFREKANGKIFTLMVALVIAAMPAYKQEDLEQLTFPVLLNKVVLAEQILVIHQSVLSGNETILDLIDPEEEEEKSKRAQTHHNTSRKPGQAVYGDPIAEKLKQALG